MAEIERAMLIKTDADANANKFYELILSDDGNVECKWGRVGATKPQTKTKAGGKHFFDKQIRAKERKGYQKAKVVTGTVAEAKVVGRSRLKDVAKKQIQHTCAEVGKLIDYLVQVNAHQIVTASGGKLNVDVASGMIKTPLGVITQDAIDDARKLLGDIAIKKDASETVAYKQLVNQFLMLVPQKTPAKRGWVKTIFAGDAVQRQNALLDSLEATLKAIADAPVDDTKPQEEKVFNVELVLDTGDKTRNYINKLYNATRKSVHSCHRLNPKRVFTVKIESMAAAFEKDGKKVGNIMRLWHGTRAANLLSILKCGLVIPPSNASYVTGRLYGNGVYFSDQSTKALNYATGYWSGTNEANSFMFLADVAMGKTYTPTGHGSRYYGRGNYPVSGYDSTFAKAGQSGVINNEMIVYSKSRCNLVYLVEFS